MQGDRVPPGLAGRQVEVDVIVAQRCAGQVGDSPGQRGLARLVGLDQGDRLRDFLIVKDVPRLLRHQRELRRTAFQRKPEDMHGAGGTTHRLDALDLAEQINVQVPAVQHGGMGILLGDQQVEDASGVQVELCQIQGRLHCPAVRGVRDRAHAPEVVGRRPHRCAAAPRPRGSSLRRGRNGRSASSGPSAPALFGGQARRHRVHMPCDRRLAARRNGASPACRRRAFATDVRRTPTPTSPSSPGRRPHRPGPRRPPRSADGPQPAAGPWPARPAPRALRPASQSG